MRPADTLSLLLDEAQEHVATTYVALVNNNNAQEFLDCIADWADRKVQSEYDDGAYDVQGDIFALVLDKIYTLNTSNTTLIAQMLNDHPNTIYCFYISHIPYKEEFFEAAVNILEAEGVKRSSAYCSFPAYYEWLINLLMNWAEKHTEIVTELKNNHIWETIPEYLRNRILSAVNLSEDQK